jgi:hypothetical protein
VLCITSKLRDCHVALLLAMTNFLSRSLWQSFLNAN